MSVSGPSPDTRTDEDNLLRDNRDDLPGSWIDDQNLALQQRVGIGLNSRNPFANSVCKRQHSHRVRNFLTDTQTRGHRRPCGLLAKAAPNLGLV
jgi:hypothetical protein